jgi:peroxiredoxin
VLPFIIGCTNQDIEFEQKIATPFILYTTDSVQYALQDYHGKIVMVNFWADWCPSCRKEFPKLQQVYEHLKGRGFEILAVNSGQSREHVRQIKEEYDLTFPVLVDEGKRVARLYGVKGLPTSCFIDQNGVIRKVCVGWISGDKIIEIFNTMKSKLEIS